MNYPSHDKPENPLEPHNPFEEGWPLTKDPLKQENPMEILAETGDADTPTIDKLLGYANGTYTEWRYPYPQKEGSISLERQREKERLAHMWITHLYRYGATKRLTDELNDKLGRFFTQAWLQIDPKDQAVHWYFLGHRLMPHADIEIALMFVTLYQRGDLNGLGRCHAPGCNKFFAGTARKKWCSNACGTNVRMQKKRKRDKERQML